MSPRQWLALLGFYTAYLFFGASVFYYTEHGYETQQRAIELKKRIAINGKWFNVKGDAGNYKKILS